MAEKAPSGTLQASSCTFSRGGQHSCLPAAAPAEGRQAIQVRWDGERVSVCGPDGAAACLASLEWRHVSGAWASVRARASRGFVLEVALEANHRGGLDFLCFAAPMAAPAGEFLSVLQDLKADKLKEGRAPSFAMSRWATPLLGAGVSANRLRVILGWCSIIWQLLFALCFFAQLDKLVVRRERQIAEQASELWKFFCEMVEDIRLQLLVDVELSFASITRVFGFGLPGFLGTAAWKLTVSSFDWLQLLLLFQHFLVFLGSVRAMWSVFAAFIHSVGTVHKAVHKTGKSLKKLGTKALDGQAEKPKGE